ncbi:hypothetical protein LTR10_018628 [Elasticomyces elasticus]|uniref:F-box domain-containing protein n=1 Tax=Exophiala sideris TaxID=1016849 RepID=A0ABR0J016_9EURO|nr:hypothetical protein LTR10_018628 [Elasticomyces elasticus]KAK5023267.1 hypothetical protein LTS07_009490 [Exophiala sideris]KAK5028639.1 hypothetical protein LTR13_009091 [Exophiala sideris]KAK5053017.1 hypothetical protein LTR69_009587 [Exophiala sideris]KAK5178757.1 hypothetical protein LTR44_008872 [Eurotiomycetes sp. CCFEE 6388]
MQPAPSEVLQNATLVEQPQFPSPSTQHGLPINVLQASGGTLSPSSPGAASSVSDDIDSISIASGETHRGRNSHVGRLSSRDDSSQGGSPGTRIDEYEKAHATQRKRSDGMIFQIVPMAKGKAQSVSIESFPNEVLTHILSHLPPETLSSMSLVSQRFHKLVTTPHAWRIAFARYFPGAEALDIGPVKAPRDSISDVEKAQRRSFTRLSALSSWRSEYILRTRLLRSLGRGRPAIEAVSRSGASRHGNSAAAAVTTYQSGLYYPVSHIHATFGVGLNKKQPSFMHAAVEQGGVSVSDPSNGKPGAWGLTDFEGFKHFADQFPGELPYGLGPGNVVGMENVMDISQPYGKLYGEACPGGRLYYTSTSEQRGRFVPISSDANHAVGIPEVTMIGCAVCSVYIAKSESLLKVTNGLFGFLAGFSNGVLAAYALGVNPVHDRRYEKGEPTARWVLCPGVPIVGICVDEKVSSRRIASKRIWATVLNALGEVYYLTETPTRPEFAGKASPADVDRLAWQTGRSVEWSLVETTRRQAKPDPFGTALVDGSYTPHTSSDRSGLSQEQTIAETKEVEKFLLYKPKYFQNLCEGWDMRRKLVVDFAGDDHHGAGESIFIVNRGLDEESVASIRRYTRCKTKVTVDFSLDGWPTIQSTMQRPSVFGTGLTSAFDPQSSPALSSVPRSRTSSHDDSVDSQFRQDWHISQLSFADHRTVQISALALYESDYATLTTNEDPLLGMSGGSTASSPLGSPLGHMPTVNSVSEIPGHRARLFGIGTMSGVVMLWDMRAGLSPSPDVVNTVQPVRIIYTKSPQIASLALTSLYVVHGGNDGLVQAWDPLASTNEAIRTLNSRFSDRARRRIAQAEASVQGVGNNYYAAGAIVLDPDPTVLRGMVSLGAYLRYWSYSSTAADAYKSRKRNQLRRRSERGSNSTPSSHKVSATGRGLLKDYISNERFEMEREKIARDQEQERLSGRFGTNLLGEGASEEELLAYATMLSQEAFSSDTVKRQANSSPSLPPSRKEDVRANAIDADLEEALRLSLLETEQMASSPVPGDFDIPIRYAKGSKRGTPSRVATPGSSKVKSSTPDNDEDLEFALQLSLAEEQSRHAAEDEFPALALSSSPGSDGNGRGKGKGKSRRR